MELYFKNLLHGPVKLLRSEEVHHEFHDAVSKNAYIEVEVKPNVDLKYLHLKANFYDSLEKDKAAFFVYKEDGHQNLSVKFKKDSNCWFQEN